MANPHPNLQNLKPMTKDRQPTPEQKSAGLKRYWERKKQAQAMMNKVMEYMNLTQAEFSSLIEDIKRNPDKYTVEDSLLAKYATKAFNSEKFMLDWFDRNISKAPTNLSNEDDKPLEIKIIKEVSDKP